MRRRPRPSPTLDSGAGNSATFSRRRYHRGLPRYALSMGIRAWLAVALAGGAAVASCTDFDNLTVPNARDAGGDARSEGGPDAGAETAASDAGACVGPHVTFEPDSGHCYEYFGGLPGSSWSSAESECVAWGGYLVSITGQAEEQLVATFADTQRAAWEAGTGGIWIGLQNVDGGYAWVDDASTYAFNNFGGEDDAAGGRTCVWQYTLQFMDRWADYMCTVPGNYVCERAHP